MPEISPPILILAPQETRARRRWALVPLILLVAGCLHWLLFQGQETITGVIARPLRTCDMDWFANKGGVLVLSCPRTDMIRLWPRPMEQPW